jgi:hypothetical protein
MFNVSRLAGAVQNQVLSGLAGYNSTLTIPIEQIEDEVVQEYLLILKKYSAKNAIPKKDLFVELGCIELDCKPLSNCCEDVDLELVSHFEIPQIMNDFGEQAIEYVGSIDKLMKFKVYTGYNFKHHKFKLRGNKKPYVFINPAINENGLLDCYVFNAPLLEKVTVIGIFKDPRQLSEYLENMGCCGRVLADSLSWLDAEIVQSLTSKYLKYYRQLLAQTTPNDSIPR